MGSQRQRGTVQDPFARGIRHCLEHPVQLVDVKLGCVFLFEQRGQVAQVSRCDTVRSSYPPALDLFQCDQPSLTCQHLDRYAQDACQELFEVKLLRDHSGNFKQIVSLTYSEIRKHVYSIVSIEDVKDITKYSWINTRVINNARLT